MSHRTVTLEKGGRKYVFRYPPGCEDRVLGEIVRLAEDGRAGLDWLDAATLSFQVAQYAAADCADALTVDARPDGRP